MKRSPLMLPLMLLAAGFANASILQTYNTEASFDAAQEPGYYDEAFSTIRSAMSLGYSGGNGYSYRASDSNLLQTLYGRLQETSPGTITITFTSPNVSAIGADFYAVNWLAQAVAATDTLTFSDGSVRTISTTTSTTTFTGYTFSAPITWMTISSGGQYAALDEFTVGTPEPGTWTLLGAGMGLLAWAKRRRR